MLRVEGVEEREGRRVDREEWLGDDGLAFARAGDCWSLEEDALTATKIETFLEIMVYII